MELEWWSKLYGWLIIILSVVIPIGLLVYSLWLMKQERGNKRSASSSIPYPYTRLNIERNEIRLVKILPSLHENDMVRCTLRHVSLSDYPAYAALSYYWGDHTDQHQIELNGQMMYVTTNLDSALRQMRTRWRSIELWIDAICIDQTNTAERAAQVLRMFAIYQEARVVAIWLGTHSDGSEKVMRMLSRNQSSEQPYDFGERFARTSFVNDEPPTRDEICEFSTRPYWRRIWIIQEITAARELCVLCGNSTIELKNFEKFFTDLVVQHNLVSTPTTPIQHLLAIRNARRDQKPVGLLNALSRTSRFSSSVEADKVYGLLGIVRDRAVFVTEPNYNLSHKQLCQAITMNVIAATGILDILLLAGHYEARSWHDDATHRALIKKNEYFHILETIEDINVSPESDLVKTKPQDIWLISKHSDLKSQFCPIDQEPFDSVWIDERKDFAVANVVRIGCRYYHASCYAKSLMEANRNPNYLDDEELPSWCPNFTNTALWEPSMVEYVSGEAYKKRLNKVTNRWNATGDTRIDASSLGFDPTTGTLRVKCLYLVVVDEVGEIIEGPSWTGLRSMTSSQGKFWGWVDSGTRPGCRICLLHGCSLPVSLQPVENYDHRFKFVGEAYIPKALDNQFGGALANDGRWIELV